MDALIVVVLILAAIVGAPLFAIFGAASMMLFTEGGEGGSLTSAAVDVFSERFADSPTLVTLPLFTFAGYLLAESGTPRRLVRVSTALFGWMPGGVPIVCLMASAFFTTFTGGSGITIVAVGGLLFPALLQQKYPERFSLGLVTTGGSLGLLFPPSIPIVLYGVVANILIDKLFLAGFLPGVLSVVILVAYAIFVGVKNRKTISGDWVKGLIQFLLFLGVLIVVGGALAGGTAYLSYVIFGDATKLLKAGLLALAIQTAIIAVAYVAASYATKGETRAALLEASYEVLLPAVLVSGMVTGVLRIHEAAAITALYALIIEVFVYKDISLKRDLPRVIKDSMTMLGAILAILATALGFTSYMIHAGVPDFLVEVMQGYITSKWTFLLCLNIFLLIVGMLMDIFSAIVVVVPLIVPIARSFGVDDYHLGIIFLLNLEIGYLTPPVGLNLFISSFRFKQPISKLYRSVLPFIGMLLVALIITTYWEPLSTMLTGLSSATEITTEEIEGEAPEPEPGGGGETLDDLDDSGGETLDDLDNSDGEHPDPPREGETLDDL